MAQGALSNQNRIKLEIITNTIKKQIFRNLMHSHVTTWEKGGGNHKRKQKIFYIQFITPDPPH